MGSIGGEGVDSARSSYPSPVHYTALYLRIVRVFYTRSVHYDDNLPLKQLTYRTFIPGQQSSVSNTDNVCSVK